MSDIKKKFFDILFEPESEQVEANGPLSDIKNQKNNSSKESVKSPNVKDVIYGKQDRPSSFIDYFEVPRSRKTEIEEDEAYEMRDNISPIFGPIALKEKKKKTASEKDIQKAVSNNSAQEYSAIVISPIYGFDMLKANDAKKQYQLRHQKQNDIYNPTSQEIIIDSTNNNNNPIANMLNNDNITPDNIANVIKADEDNNQKGNDYIKDLQNTFDSFDNYYEASSVANDLNSNTIDDINTDFDDMGSETINDDLLNVKDANEYQVDESINDNELLDIPDIDAYPNEDSDDYNDNEYLLNNDDSSDYDDIEDDEEYENLEDFDESNDDDSFTSDNEEFDDSNTYEEQLDDEQINKSYDDESLNGFSSSDNDEDADDSLESDDDGDLNDNETIENDEIEEIDNNDDPVEDTTSIPSIKDDNFIKHEDNIKSTRSIYDTTPIQLFDFDELTENNNKNNDLFDELIGDDD